MYVVLGGLGGGPRSYEDQFGGVNSHRVPTRKVFFLHKSGFAESSRA